MLILICLILGFCLGYYIRGQKQSAPPQSALQNQPPQRSHVQRLYSKSQHRSDSDRIRDLNQLSTHQAAFLRLLKQTFFNYEVSIKQQRFFILDQDKMPLAIFEYRDGTQSFKATDQEDGIPIYIYKALISSEALQQDLQAVLLQQRIR
ncbi:hypothetical protein E0H86_06655 [Acinetobacter sp. ANC 4635]|uniref:hypothetical protein n=1 Tax=Acinetobacter sp. ANC 4635 TaxID=2529846 RepID=UPI00103FF89C|nr:hypothetical protein [Acinetobacter sp. ANC 4635]TCB32093.1 hypothetical protein E0H86_06655 [Acinetobacter sp. ANC 4635]